MKKITRTYRFDKEVITHAMANQEISSFSEYCCIRYREDYMALESEIQLLEKHTKIIESCKKNIENLRGKHGRSMFRVKELDWIKKKGVKAFHSYSQRGVLMRFNNLFGRHVKISQFRRMIEHVEKEMKVRKK